MPYSSDENRDYVVDIVSNKIKPRSALDVGAGSGTYGDLLREHVQGYFDAVEVWQPYIMRFDLTRKYDNVYPQDIREFLADDFNYDLIIFGDVLEHMSLEDAKAVWEKVSQEATWAMISIPIVHYPQGPEEGNPYEVHVQDHITPAELIRDFGPFDHFQIFDVTGTFFRRFR